MRKVVQLKDGTEVVIRHMKHKDLDQSFHFFQQLPDEDRKYLRRDVTRKEIIKHRIRSAESDKIKRLVALHDGKIVADGALELGAEEWKRHIGEIRLIIARPYQRKGLGTLMARELYLLAAQEKVEDIVVKMMRPQVAALSIFKKLGFAEDTTFTQYVKDRSGSKQDLIVMRCNLQALMKEMEDALTVSDWQRTR